MQFNGSNVDDDLSDAEGPVVSIGPKKRINQQTPSNKYNDPIGSIESQTDCRKEEIDDKRYQKQKGWNNIDKSPVGSIGQLSFDIRINPVDAIGL